MEIDLPEVVAEVREAFAAYEKALVENDVPALNAMFRAACSPVALGRTLSRTVIATYGREFAVASTLYERPSAPGKTGRQMQTWVRFPEGWRVVAAHVSLIDAPK